MGSIVDKIGIINYDVGNLRSIQKAFEYNQIEAIISSDLEKLNECDKLVLPGVGAFSECKGMIDKKFDNKLIFLLEKKPVLGICVGMQLLFDYSCEFYQVEGLKLIDGFIDKLKTDSLPVPNVGWNKVKVVKESLLFNNIAEDSFFYFTHSYKCNVLNDINKVALVEYEKEFCCVVCKDNIYGVQFHPEKSGEDGLLFLKNFAMLKN